MDLFKWFVVNIPVFIVLAVIAVIIVIIVRKKLSHGRKKDKGNNEDPNLK